jgi:small subunit ribosomal protein S9
MKNVSTKTEVEVMKAVSEQKETMLDSLTANVNSMVARSQENVKKEKKQEVYFGIGKRKTAFATAEIRKGSGRMTINGKEIYHYFSFSMLRGRVLLPLQLTDTICSYDVKLTVQGGGTVGQADACIPAISKALIRINPEWRPMLAKNLLIKHDPRNVEPKKPGRIKARKGYVYNRR